MTPRISKPIQLFYDIKECWYYSYRVLGGESFSRRKERRHLERRRTAARPKLSLTTLYLTVSANSTENCGERWVREKFRFYNVLHL